MTISALNLPCINLRVVGNPGSPFKEALLPHFFGMGPETCRQEAEASEPSEHEEEGAPHVKEP